MSVNYSTHRKVRDTSHVTITLPNKYNVNSNSETGLHHLPITNLPPKTTTVLTFLIISSLDFLIPLPLKDACLNKNFFAPIWILYENHVYMQCLGIITWCLWFIHLLTYSYSSLIFFPVEYCTLWMWLLLDMGIVPSFWLLSITLLWTYLYICIGTYVQTFLLSTYLATE